MNKTPHDIFQYKPVKVKNCCFENLRPGSPSTLSRVKRAKPHFTMCIIILFSEYLYQHVGHQTVELTVDLVV